VKEKIITGDDIDLYDFPLCFSSAAMAPAR
jgi:hypothetical protein